MGYAKFFSYSLLALFISSKAVAADFNKYYCDQYDACRANILNRAKEILNVEENAKLETLKVPSKVDDKLYIDSLYLPAKTKEENLIILSSGVHGVEGITGSALQMLFLQEILPKLERNNLGVLLIHSINPYGFKHVRRVSENNVDLNRNFDTVADLFSLKNDDYTKLNEFLNPTTPVKEGFLNEVNFYYHVVRLLMKEPMGALKQATLKGQYQYPDGLYYGGKEFEPQKKMLEAVLLEKSKNYKNILMIDLHTGYGKRGVLHLFPNPTEDKKLKAAMKAVFGQYPIEETEDGGNFYENYGDFSNYVQKLLNQEKKFVVPMVFEYGTVNNHKNYYWAIESIRRMIAENQLVHNKADSKKTEAKVKSQFLELYYPSSKEWRKQVAEVTLKVLPQFVDRFQKLDR